MSSTDVNVNDVSLEKRPLYAMVGHINKRELGMIMLWSDRLLLVRAPSKVLPVALEAGAIDREQFKKFDLGPEGFVEDVPMANVRELKVDPLREAVALRYRRPQGTEAMLELNKCAKQMFRGFLYETDANLSAEHFEISRKKKLASIGAGAFNIVVALAPLMCLLFVFVHLRDGEFDLGEEAGNRGLRGPFKALAMIANATGPVGTIIMTIVVTAFAYYYFKNAFKNAMPITHYQRRT